MSFVTAPASERTLTVGAYLGGALELALVVAALAFGAHRVRALLLPGWSGAPARLAEAVLAVAGLIWVCEALGSFGGFDEGPVLGATVATGLAAGLIATRLAADRAVGPAAAPPAPATWGPARVIAVLACAGLAAAWMVPTLGTLAAGMDRADSLWYHMPLAARFVQTGHLGQIEFFDPIFLASFYPANSEVPHALGILFFDRDSVSPVLNLGLLSMALLAAWCIGRPYGLGPQTLIGASVALGSQSLVEFQAGEALNDITGVAFVLAAVALLVNGYAAGERGQGPPARPTVTGRAIGAGALAVAGIAAGLAAGTKLSFLAPVAALTVAVVVIAPRMTRLRATALWSLPMLAAGGYWYARNLIAVGNPIPYIGSLGPISLPAPVRDFQLRPDFAVVHYWNDTEVWREWFGPGLNDSFGTLWPLTLAAMIAVAVLAVWRGSEPILRALGAFVIVTTVAYLFTPLTAAGEEGQPISFVWNVRYLAPAVAVGLAILPCLPTLRATPRRRAAVLGVLTVLLAFTVGSLVQWEQGHTKGAVAAAGLVVTCAALVFILRSRGVLGPAGRLARPGCAGGRCRRDRGRGRLPRAGPLPHPPVREHRPGAGSRRGAALVARRARCPDRPRRHPRRVHAVPLLRHRPLEPGAVARPPRPARRLPANPRLPPVAAGDRYGRVHARRHHLRSLPPGWDAQLARGALDAVRPQRPDRPARRPREGVRAPRAARSRRLRGPKAAHAGTAPQRAEPQRHAAERLSPGGSAGPRTRKGRLPRCSACTPRRPPSCSPRWCWGGRSCTCWGAPRRPGCRARWASRR